jgi:ABC-type antimicrobial peptide transport system permease subunit
LGQQHHHSRRGSEGSDEPESYFNAITPSYFDALGIPVKAGRDLRWDDWGGSKKLCLVNEALVNEYLGGANAVGRLVSDMRTLDDQLNRRLSNERLLSFLSVGFAFLASLLAVIGLHGVLSFVVARRTREIGIRIALGAGAAG